MPLSADDRLAITDVHARYYIATDEKDLAGFLACWVDDDDIVFESVFGNFTGRKAIYDFEDEHVHRGMAIGKRHFLANVSIIEGETSDIAYATSYMTVVDVVNAPAIVATGIYRNSKLERTSDGWKFRHRQLDVDPGFQKLMEQQKTA